MPPPWPPATPLAWAWLLNTRQFVMVRLPALKMPPPRPWLPRVLRATLLVITMLVRARVPRLKIPPPRLLVMPLMIPETPPVMVRPEMLTVTPEAILKIWVWALPLMVMRPEPGPLMVRFLPMGRLPVVRVMVPERLPAKSTVPPLGVRKMASRSEPVPLLFRFVTVVKSKRSSRPSTRGRKCRGGPWGCRFGRGRGRVSQDKGFRQRMMQFLLVEGRLLFPSG